MRRLVILLVLLLAACGSRGGDDSRLAGNEEPAPAATAPVASASREPSPPPAGVEAAALGTLRGDWAFVSRTVSDPADGWGTSEIWAVPLDGGAPRLALRYPRSWSDPLFAGWQLSPEGRRFAFATEVEGVQRLLVADLERGTVRRAHDDDGPLHDGEATWSPDGGRLAFVRYAREPRQAGAYAGLWLVDLDVGAPRRLVESNDQPTRLYPWTPDGRIALAHGVGYLILDPDSGQSAAIERIVTPADWRRGSPSWVAFRADGIGEERHIIVGEADLSRERVIVREREPVFLSRPRWNPVRDEILYVRAEPTGGPTSLVEIRTLVLGAEPRGFAVAGRPLIVEWAPSGDAILYLNEEHAPTDRGFSSELVSLRLATRSGEDREIFRPEGGGFPSAIGAIGARRYPSATAVRESAAPTAPQPTGPMTSPRPVQQLDRIETFALGELSGRWAFALSIGQLPGTSPQLGELWAVPLDGGAPRLAARFPTVIGTPGSGPDSNVLERQLSPDGRRIVLSAGTAEGGLGMRYRLFIVELETGEFRMVGRDDGDHDVRPAWSADGTRIAYVRSLVERAARDGFDDGLWVMEADGSGARRVVASRQGTGTANFGWSPDGKWIAYAHAFEDATFQLLEVETGRTVPYGYVQQERPYHWRPDGALAIVTYSTPRMGSPAIGIADAPGEPLRTIAEWDPETYVDNVRWRPGADEIAYAAKTVTRGTIVVRGVAGGAVERVFDRIARAVAWSSDGREIAYLHAGQSSDRPAVHVFGVDGGPERVIEVPASWLLGDLTTRGYP